MAEYMYVKIKILNEKILKKNTENSIEDLGTICK